MGYKNICMQKKGYSLQAKSGYYLKNDPEYLKKVLKQVVKIINKITEIKN